MGFLKINRIVHVKVLLFAGLNEKQATRNTVRRKVPPLGRCCMCYCTKILDNRNGWQQGKRETKVTKKIKTVTILRSLFVNDKTILGKIGF